MENSILDAVASAAFVIDAHGKVIDRNLAADALLSERGTPVVRLTAEGRLTTGMREQDKPFGEAVRRALGTPAGSSAARLTHDDGRPLGVICTPVSAAALVAWREARVLISIADPRGRARHTADILRACFELTPAEARIASLVGCGLGSPEIATRFGLSRETVKRHLAHIFVKTGTRSQVNLARLISSMLHL